MPDKTAARRPSAQDFLELVERGKRGRLKLYIGFAAADNPANPLDGTFNRFDVQALANSNPVDIGRIDLSQGVTVGTGLGSHLFFDDDGPTGAPSAARISPRSCPVLERAGPSPCPATLTSSRWNPGTYGPAIRSVRTSRKGACTGGARST